MRYELIPRMGEFVSVYNDIPNKAYVYSNELSSLQVALVKKVENQFVTLDMSNKVSTANTLLGTWFNNNPNDEVYLIDLRSKYDSFVHIENKLDINMCNVCLKLDVKYSIRITDPIAFITNNHCFSVGGHTLAIQNRIKQIFYDALNQYTVDGYDLITSGYQLNEITQRVKYDITSKYSTKGLSISIHELTLRVHNFQDVSDFYSYDRKRKIELEERIVDRLIDTVFNQYAHQETISNNQVKVLETYLNNAIIEAKDFKPDEFMANFLSYQQNYSLSDLIENLDQANKRFIRSSSKYSLGNKEL